MDMLEEIKACLIDGEKIICVSTQLIEAGIDISFGAVVRHLAGLDSIAQAAGRCNRHGMDLKGGAVFIINPNYENLDKLYDIRCGAECTMRVLEEYRTNPAQFDDDIIGLKAMERFYTFCFHQREPEMGYMWKNGSQHGTLFNLLSCNHKSVAAFRRTQQGTGEQPPLLPQAFRTAGEAFAAIDSDGMGVVVPYRLGKALIAELRYASEPRQVQALMKRAQRYAINLRPHEYQAIRSKGGIELLQNGRVSVLAVMWYNSDIGV